jgi:predicted Zn-dependent protease
MDRRQPTSPHFNIRFNTPNRAAVAGVIVVLSTLITLPASAKGQTKKPVKPAISLEASAEKLRAAVAANPESGELHGELGRILIKQGKYEEATSELGIAANQLPDSRIYNMALAEALLGWQHWGVVVEFLNATRERFQQYPEFHYYFGLANFKQNKPKDALPEFAEALRLEPRLALAKFGLAACRAATGDFPGAAALSRELVMQEPRNPHFWLALAQVLDSMGETERLEALRASQRALALRPREPAIQLKTGIILARLGRHSEALPLLERVVKAEPKNLQAHVSLASTYARLGKPLLAKKQNEIVVELEKAKAEHPQNPGDVPIQP